MNNKTLLIIGAGVGVVLVARYLVGKTGDVASAINPASHDNIFYQGVNDFGEAMTGSKPGGWSLGSWVYDLMHPSEGADLVSAPTQQQQMLLEQVNDWGWR